MKTTTATLPLPPVTGRSCAGCSLCCKLVSVREIGKPKNVWCPHAEPARARCSIYDARTQSCVKWSCSWLVDDSLPDELQPHRSHVIFDILPDIIRAGGVTHPVAQLWVDPAYPAAHREPPVRAMIERIASVHDMPVLARIGTRGLLIVAPSLNGGTWLERETVLDADFGYGGKSHTEMMIASGLIA